MEETAFCCSRPRTEGSINHSLTWMMTTQTSTDGTVEPPMTGLHSFLSDSVDWARMGLTGGLSRRTSQALSGGAEYPLGSSLDLSPSDSGSGGTYMWDEEGLEALGTITHPCGSYDSDLNSMDILNNLDNLESGCDLDDDDLMLDDDLPAHGSLHSDTDGMSHLTHWRRQLCWNAEDHLHNDNRSDVGFQPYDGYQGTGLSGLHQAVELDELTLKHMAEDCCSVKTQLEHLKLLLQVEVGSEMDNTLDTLSPESREDPIRARQVEELLKEVQELREELRSKDRIIAQLTKHVAVPVEPTRCHCQQHRDVESVTVTYHDKATQTPPWRGHAPQILQPSRPWPNSVQQPQPQERLTSSAHTEAPRDSSNPGCGDPAKMIPAPSLPQSPGSLKTASIPKRPQEGPITNSTQTSMAGFPRVVRGIQFRSSPRPGFTTPQSRLLPPPFRGLPCYSSSNQASASSQGPALPACPRTRAPRQTPGLREPEIGGLKARGLVHPSLLRLPKPKSH
nr:serine-rich coiled-coil domain-containing protein 2-like isoform X1 [Oncorhynchus nerka]